MWELKQHEIQNDCGNMHSAMLAASGISGHSAFLGGNLLIPIKSYTHLLTVHVSYLALSFNSRSQLPANQARGGSGKASDDRVPGFELQPSPPWASVGIVGSDSMDGNSLALTLKV